VVLPLTMTNLYRKLFLLKEFQESIGYNFNNVNILDESLTHNSVRGNNRDRSNNRLEWLGDNILQHVISCFLFYTNPNDNVGELSKKRQQLVSASKQKEIAKILNIRKYITFRKDFEYKKFDRYDKFVESLIGAIYVDAGIHGYRVAANFIYKFWGFYNYIYIEPSNRCTTNKIIVFFVILFFSIYLITALLYFSDNKI